MEHDMIATHLGNLDRRLAKIEQILPTLATKDEIRILATKAELAAAIASLATREDLRELRRHMDVLNESLREDIHLIAGHVASARPKDNEP